MSQPAGDCVSQMRAAIGKALSSETCDHSAEPCGKPAALLRATIPMPDGFPLDWLHRLPGEQRFYGSTRSPSLAIEIGGVGVADEAAWPEAASYQDVFARLQSVLAVSASGIRYYGGFRFSADSPVDPDWALFGFCRFIVPRLEFIRSSKGCLLSLHFTRSDVESGVTDDWVQRLATMRFDESEWSESFPPPQARHEIPDYSGWERNIEAALAQFESGDLQKIVLARKADFIFGERLDPIVLLHRLQGATPECFHFCYMPHPDLAFVGASPERLYQREGRTLSTEAVAGTRMRGKTPEQDRELADQLLSSDKDLREHEYVRLGIHRALVPLSTRQSMDPAPRLLRLARGQHLYSTAQADLRDDTTDAALLAALHPTPALGGYPTPAAMALIARLETFDRGWYAAPVGWVSRDEAEFAVAIRSGLVQPRKLSLYSGAGIVAGSTPESEWEEIELKIRDFIKVLTMS